MAARRRAPVPAPERSSRQACAQYQLRVPACAGIQMLRCFCFCARHPVHSPDSAPDRPGGVSIMTSAPVTITTGSWRLRLPSIPPIRPRAGTVKKITPMRYRVSTIHAPIPMNTRPAPSFSWADTTHRSSCDPIITARTVEMISAAEAASSTPSRLTPGVVEKTSVASGVLSPSSAMKMLANSTRYVFMRSFISGRNAAMAHEDHDVAAPAVSIRQGGARRVNAQDVTIRQGGSFQISAGTVRVSQGGVGLAMAEKATIEQGAAQAVIARDTVTMDQAAAGVVMARRAHARQSAIGILVANEVKGDGLRVLISVRSAFAFGAGLGFAAALLRLLRRR